MHMRKWLLHNLGLKLLSRGRLSFRPSKIKGHDDLAKIMKKLASKEGK